MRLFRTLNLVAVLLCFCVVVFGAYVRLADAGLGCPDWPGCYGHLTIPQTDQEVLRAEQAYPERPVEAPKAWKEMIHRYLASVLGLLIVGLALLSLKVREAPRVLPWALLGLVIFQGVLGMWTVTWQLKPLVVTAHLLGGMTTLSLLFWLWWSTRPARQLAVSATPALRALALAGLVAVVMQIFLGGWTSTNYAALACPDFPTCHNTLSPELDLPTAFDLWHGLGINYEYGILDARARITIHWVHRLGAIAVTAVLLGLAWALWRRGETLWKGCALAVVAALSLQIVIGISIVKLQLPLLLAASHNGGAALLLLTLVTVTGLVWQARRSAA
ncbi:MAG TPA: COX15/CtaA family protein [Nevskiaceae bacterium]|nr:COX15/CtaA family protein [Nevskiaceae bacterium]